MVDIKKTLAGLTGLWVVLILVGARHAVPLQGLVFADVPLSQQADPCPPECVTDSMEIVTWYPSPYNEYEELRLYPTQRDANYCDNDKIGLMYYDHGGTPSFPDNDKMMICKGTLLGWQEVGGEGFWKFADSSTSDIYYTKSGNVGIGTDTPSKTLHIVGSGTSGVTGGDTITFSYTGGIQNYTVPNGVRLISVEVVGGSGGESSTTGYCPAKAGGLGGKSMATIAVTPGETLSVYVGRQGVTGSNSNGGAGGWNGGGNGGGGCSTYSTSMGFYCSGGGGGGGASEIHRGSTRLIVAGGAGGGGGCAQAAQGGAGGSGGIDNHGNGANGDSYYGNCSGGCSGGSGGNMSSGQGGNGGGGANDYGGGGGGGGGGSGYVISTATNVLKYDSVNSGDGKIKISPFSPDAIYSEGNIIVAGSVVASVSKNFEISHPSKPGMKLVHSSLEGPEVGVYYRGQARLDNGQAIITLPDYFEALTRVEDRTVQLTAKGEPPFLLSYAAIKDGKFSVYGTNPNGEFSWEVKAVRKDIPPLVVEKE